MTQFADHVAAPSPSPDDAPEPLDLAALSRLLRRRASLMLAVFVLVLAGVGGWRLRQPQVYEAQTTLLISNSGANAAGALASSEAAQRAMSRLKISGGPSSLETARLLLEDIDLVERAVKELGLRRPAAEVLAGVHAEVAPRSELIRLTVQSPTAAEAASLADCLARLYVESSGRFEREAAERAAQQLRGTMTEIRKQLQQSEEALLQFQNGRGGDSPELETARVTGIMSTLDRDQLAARTDREGAERQAAYYRQRLGETRRTQISSATITRPATVRAQEAELADLQVQRAGLASSYGPEHATMRELDERIRRLQAQLRQSPGPVVDSRTETPNPLAQQLASSLATAEAQVRSARTRETALNELARKVQSELKTLPGEQMQATRLRRTADLGAEVYSDLLRQYQQAAAQAAAEKPAATIVSKARTPQQPSAPQYLRDLVLAALLALVLAGMAGAGAELLDSRLHAPADLRSCPQVRLLGTLPHGTLSGPLLQSNPSAEMIDAARLLRRNLNGGATARTLLVTGVERRDGSTAVALSTALAAAEAGQKVLLVEADLRHGALGAQLAGAGAGGGLAAVLSGTLTAEAAVTPTARRGLHVVPAGQAGESIPALLDRPAAAEAFAQWAAAYDAVVVDAPAAAAYPDAALLGALCDAAVLVARAGRTNRRAACEAADLLRRAGVPLRGVVLNDLRA